MSGIDYQALREAADAIKIIAMPQKLLAFRMKVTPQVVLALLDELETAKKRIAELETRTVFLPKLPVLGSTEEWYEGFAAGASSMRNECTDAIRVAGIRIKGE